MNTKLEQLTIGQFIDLVCGDVSVLSAPHEVVNDTKALVATRNIIIEYKEIADPASVKGYLSDVEDLLKAKVDVIIFTMCHNLVAMGEHDRAREVVLEYGINADSMNKQRISAEVESRMARAKAAVEKIESEKDDKTPGQSDLRREFDYMTASLMSYFKFQIDTSTMKATLYAHLIARHNREIKAQIAALKK